MSLVGMFKSNGANGFGYGSTAEQVTEGLSLGGKTVLVTGCTSGLGQEAVRVLALRGAQVLATARTLDKAQAACAEVQGKTVPLACELSDPASVRGCVEAVKQGGYKLDAIVCNAGIMALPKLEKKFGTELQFFTNHIGHFMLVTGLLEQLTEAGRVVVLTSNLHSRAPEAGIEFDNLSGDREYAGWKAYGQSKLANLLFAKELSRRFAGTGKTAFAVHPGVIKTSLSRHMSPVMGALFGAMAPIFLKTIPQGAATEVYAAVHPDAAKTNGAYLSDCNVAKPRKDAEDPVLASKLWEASEKLVASLSR